MPISSTTCSVFRVIAETVGLIAMCLTGLAPLPARTAIFSSLLDYKPREPTDFDKDESDD